MGTSARHRNTRKAAFVLPFLLVSAAMPAHAESVELNPSTRWHVEWTDETCRMVRDFGGQDDRVTIALEQFAPGPRFQLVVIGKRFKNVGGRNQLKIVYGDGPQTRVSLALGADADDGRSAMVIRGQSLLSNAPDPVPPTFSLEELEQSVDAITFIWRNQKVTLRTGSLAKPFNAMRTCTDDLLNVWGLDPETQRTLTRSPEPKGSPELWLRYSEYPKVELRRGDDAVLNFRLIVNAQGEPTDCEIQRSYSGEAFDDLTCDSILARARFEPALDAQGNPVASFYLNSVTWIAP